MLYSNKDLRRLILPLIVEYILSISVGMIDTMMISYAGDAAISGVSLVDMVNNLIIDIFSALATGGAVIVSQYLGRRDTDSASSSAGQLITLTALISLTVTALCLLLRSPILHLLFGTIEPDVMDSAMTYFRISAYSFPFLALNASCAALYRSMNNSRLTMAVAMGMNVLNVAGNSVLIFGFHMGVAGAAYSTLFSRAASAFTLFFLLTKPGKDVILRARAIFSWNAPLLRRIVFIAIPNGVENAIFSFGRILVVSVISGFGTAQIAANAVANNLDYLGVFAGQAMNLAMITVVGRCLGAGDTDAAEYYAKKLLKITYLMTLGVNIVLFSLLSPVLHLYSLSDEARHLAAILVIIHNGFGVLLWPLAFTLPNCLRAGGDVKFTMTVSVISMCVFRVLFSYLLGAYLGMGAVGVWIAMLFDWICRLTCFCIRFRKGTWKTIKVI